MTPIKPIIALLGGTHSDQGIFFASILRKQKIVFALLQVFIVSPKTALNTLKLIYDKLCSHCHVGAITPTVIILFFSLTGN
jgi:hypothetical protein